MDGQRFDALARGLASGQTRRQALKTLFAGAVGLAGIRQITNASAGGCLGYTETCDNDAQCCSGSCESGACTCVTPGSLCYTNDDCCSGLVCIEGAHFSGGDACGFPEEPDCTGNEECSGDQICVDGKCTDPSTCGEGDPGHCVNYDSECCPGYYCVGQQCIEIPVCAPLYCSSIVSCCDDKICLTGNSTPPEGEFSGGSCYVRIGQPCDDNGEQGCQAGECIDGYCGGPPECLVAESACSQDSECCSGLTCIDGACGVASDPDPDDGGAGSDGGGEESSGGDDSGYVPVTLPNTGAGTDADGSSALLVAGLASGTAALIAATKLKTSESRE